jgi:hypothetical protein
MPVPGFHFRLTPVVWLLLAVGCAPHQPPAASNLDANALGGMVVGFVGIVVYLLVHLLLLLGYLLAAGLVVVLLLSPVLLAFWLLRRTMRKRGERASWPSGKVLRNPGPSVPLTQQPDERIPLLARRFKQPPSP